jgi:DNA polymerase-4
MGLPVTEIKDVLTQMGLEAPEVRVVRMTGVRVRLVITAFLDPNRFVPLEQPEPDRAVPAPAEGMTDTLPRPAETDLTIVPGIGRATAQKLGRAGCHTIAQLRALTEEELEALLSPSSIKQAKGWLSSNP